MPTNNNYLSLGNIFRQKREEKKLLVRQVAADLQIDQALISRIENSGRLPTKNQVYKLAVYYGLDLDVTLSTWLAERILRSFGGETYAPAAFKVVHAQISQNGISETEPAKIVVIPDRVRTNKKQTLKKEKSVGQVTESGYTISPWKSRDFDPEID